MITLDLKQLQSCTLSLRALINAVVEGRVVFNPYTHPSDTLWRVSLTSEDLAKLRSLIPPPVFDPSKPVQTRDGRAARILCTDLKRAGDGDAAEGGGDARTMVVALMGTHDSSHGEYVHLYTPDGCYYASKEPCRDDIINIPEQPQ